MSLFSYLDCLIVPPTGPQVSQGCTYNLLKKVDNIFIMYYVSTPLFNETITPVISCDGDSTNKLSYPPIGDFHVLIILTDIILPADSQQQHTKYSAVKSKKRMASTK